MLPVNTNLQENDIQIHPKFHCNQCPKIFHTTEALFHHFELNHSIIEVIEEEEPLVINFAKKSETDGIKLEKTTKSDLNYSEKPCELLDHDYCKLDLVQKYYEKNVENFATVLMRSPI